jgi:hypothetical protein
MTFTKSKHVHEDNSDRESPIPRDNHKSFLQLFFPQEIFQR